MKEDKLGAKRVTNQRQVILEELKKLTTHPTAEELYLIIKDKIPNISIGTVYRNLNNLAEKGYILKLDNMGSQNRFDGNTEPHIHIVCVKCGKVRDIHKNFSIPKNYKELSKEFEILGYNFNLYGICKECTSK